MSSHMLVFKYRYDISKTFNTFYYLFMVWESHQAVRSAQYFLLALCSGFTPGRAGDWSEVGHKHGKSLHLWILAPNFW